mgnify:CR=1 FL=1
MDRIAGFRVPVVAAIHGPALGGGQCPVLHLARVTKDGRRGVFTSAGVWVEGDIRQADPHLCLWVAGRQLPNRFQQAAQAMSE